MKKLYMLVLITCILAAIGFAYWKLVIPTHRVEVRSELIMLGDLDDDNRWTDNDLKTLDAFLHNPFSMPDSITCRIDMNQNGLIDEEDLEILRSLVSAKGDPYAAQDAAVSTGKPFPRPRECESVTLGQPGAHPTPCYHSSASSHSSSGLLIPS